MQQLFVFRAVSASPSGPLVVVKGQGSGKGQNVDGRHNLTQIKRSNEWEEGSAWAEEVQQCSADEAG